MTLRVVRLMDEPDWQSLLPRVEEIFFTSSAVQQFTDDAHRERFKVRWLGRYLDRCLESFFVALADASLLPPPERGRVGWGSTESPQRETVLGYLAGCLANPARDPLFVDLAYYQAFAPYCASYPCHLHINVAEGLRSRGVGAALIEAFAAQCADARLPGLHLVTNEGARNVRFYEKCGFKVLATTLSHGTAVVFMGRPT